MIFLMFSKVFFQSSYDSLSEVSNDLIYELYIRNLLSMST
jgi:hypothetical protein